MNMNDRQPLPQAPRSATGAADKSAGKSPDKAAGGLGSDATSRRHTQSPFALMASALGSPRDAVKKAARLARLLAGYVAPAELDARLQRLHHRPDRGQQVFALGRECQQACAAVLLADHALHQALALQALDHSADRGTVEADRRGQAGLVDGGLLGNRIERCELHRREVEARGLHLRLKDLRRLLVQASDQVPGHLDPVHRSPPPRPASPGRRIGYAALDVFSIHTYYMQAYHIAAREPPEGDSVQFHLNGFKPGDPDVLPAAPGHRRSGDPLPERVDVLIAGTGPAGLCLAAQLARVPQIRTLVVEPKLGPMEKGQADGISVRSMEMFQAFGFGEKVMRESVWINETTFWAPGADAPLSRVARVQDVPDGISEMPHVLINQARVHDMFLGIMHQSPTRLEPDYGLKVLDLSVDPGAAEYPVTVTLEHTAPGREGQTAQVRANYVIGCDGARSNVRSAIGGALHGDAAHHAWGVMDLLAVTDFPDWRMKSFVRSKDEGILMVLPREGGHLVRLYVELDRLGEHERVSERGMGAQDIIANAMPEYVGALGVGANPQLQQRRAQAGQAGLGRVRRAVAGHRARQHLAGERGGDHAHAVDAHFGAQQQQTRGVDEQRRGAAAQVAGGDDLALHQPALFQQFTHQQADGGLGQAHGLRQIRPRQARVRAQPAHQGHAVDAFQQLLVTGGLSGQGLSPDG